MTGSGRSQDGAAARAVRPARRPRAARRGGGPPPGWVVGAKSVLRALTDEGAPAFVVVARDAPPDVVTPVLDRARALGVRVVEAESATALGLTCGVARPVVTAVPADATR